MNVATLKCILYLPTIPYVIRYLCGIKAPTLWYILLYKHVQCMYVCYNADVNECDNSPDLCSPGGMCVNNDDGEFYRCECYDGFTNNNDSASRSLENCTGMW